VIRRCIIWTNDHASSERSRPMMHRASGSPAALWLLCQSIGQIRLFRAAVAIMLDDRLASLFTPDGVLRMPNVPAELSGREEIRAIGPRRDGLVEYFLQNTHPGTIQLDGDTATGRAYMFELIGLRDSGSELNYAIYHDRYRRTPDGWKFTERVYEVRYHDTTPLAGSAPTSRGAR